MTTDQDRLLQAVDDAVVEAELAEATRAAAAERKRAAVKAALEGGVPLETLEERGVYTIQHLRRIAREMGIAPRSAGRKRKTAVPDDPEPAGQAQD